MTKVELITTIEYNVPDEEDILKRDTSNLVKKLFFIQEEKKGCKVKLKEENGVYNFEVIYGELGITPQEVADYQNLLRNCFENAKHVRPNIKNGIIDIRRKTTELDLLGFKRIERYLTK
ncbi:MAG: hypothetical protein ACOC1P_00760 [Minisyncoccales bacterium]